MASLIHHRYCSSSPTREATERGEEEYVNKGRKTGSVTMKRVNMSIVYVYVPVWRGECSTQYCSSQWCLKLKKTHIYSTAMLSFTFIHAAESLDLAKAFQNGNCFTIVCFEDQRILRKLYLRVGA